MQVGGPILIHTPLMLNNNVHPIPSLGDTDDDPTPIYLQTS